MGAPGGSKHSWEIGFHHRHTKEGTGDVGLAVALTPGPLTFDIEIGGPGDGT